LPDTLAPVASFIVWCAHYHFTLQKECPCSEKTNGKRFHCQGMLHGILGEDSKGSVHGIRRGHSVELTTPGLSNGAPVIYFTDALIYSAGFNVNQNFKKKKILNNGMFQYFSYHSHEHGLPAFAISFSFVPTLLPLTPHFPFSLVKALASEDIPSNNASQPTLWGTGDYYCWGVKSVFTQLNLTRTFLFTDKNYFV
jgi:hypothetical protein